MSYLIVALGAIFITFLILLPRIKKINQFNAEIEQQNNKLKEYNQNLNNEQQSLLKERVNLSQEIDDLFKKRIVLNKDIEDYHDVLNNLQSENLALTNLKVKLQEEHKSIQEQLISESAHLKREQDNIEALKNIAQQSANDFYTQAMELAGERLNADLGQKEEEFKQAKNKLQDEYINLMFECSEDMQAELAKRKSQLDDEINKKKTELDSLSAELADLRNKTNAAIEQAKRQEELENNLKFYQVNLTKEDEDEVKALMSIEYLLRNKRNLYMLIWTSYYSKAVNDLAGRVLGPKPITGIYKITNIQTKQVYIGQAQDVRVRWRDHVKAGGLHIDCPATNGFYKNMGQYGIENFTFELQEECPADKLNEREKYWIDFFQSKTSGLNGNSGGS